MSIIKDKNITACFFDLYDTLVYLDPENYNQKQSRCAKLLGVELTRYKEVWRSLIFDSNLGKIKTTQDRIKALENPLRIKINKSLIEQIAGIEHDFLRSSVKLYDCTTTALVSLRKMGFKTAIVSNASISVLETIKATELGNYVDHMIFSFKVGSRKPQPKIYLDALNRSMVSADQVMFIGDGNDKELEGAKNLGMTTVKINHTPLNGHTSVQSDAMYIDFCIDNLSEVIDILNRD